jgi:P4 family phage/plasmid primase-like protien
MEFNKVQECKDYCKENNLAYFRRDLNASGAKVLVADTFQNIYNKITTENKAHWYESWGNQNMKLYIDYDRKVEAIYPGEIKKHPKNEHASNHKTDILNIISIVKSFIPNVTGVYILKSIPDITKKSYHIIFDGIHFSNNIIIKKFTEEQLKPKLKELFDKNIIDTKVYGNLCFRSLLCTKFGQNRPLYLLQTEQFLSELQEIPIPKSETTLELFLKTCITHIEPDSHLFNYKSEKKKNTSKKIHLMNEEDIYSDREIVKKYLDVLDPERYIDWGKWLNVGFILYSINNDFNDLWHYFSAKWEDYDEDKCENTWKTFANSEYIYTINNLIALAQTDNPDESIELSKEIPSHDIKYLRPFDNVLSKLIFRLYGNKFICSSPERNEWYYFNGQRWKKENKNFNLRHKIINEVFSKIENYRRQLIKEGASDEIIKNYHNILLKLGSGIKLICLELEFYNQNFYKLIDQNKDLLGFENGVFDLNIMEFRNGVCADYISMTTDYDYIHYPKDHPLYIELHTLLEQILPNEQTREFTLKSLSSCLDGHNRDENFYIWSGKAGSGGNGKSTLTELLSRALGEYSIESPISLITGKRESSNSANAALAAIRNKRAVIMQEPAADDVIQADTMKLLSGGDKVSTRELYGMQLEFKPMAKYIVPTNKLPSISSMDGGVVRRLKITEFTSKFVENPDTTNKYMHEFKINKELKQKLDTYKPVFMSILLDYYRIYRTEGLIPPPAVTKVTKKYENNNNNIKTFIDEHIIKGNKNTCILKEDVKDIYKSDQLLKASFPKITVFLNSLENALATEFRLDAKLKVYKIDGYFIKGPNVIDDKDEEENVNLNNSDNDSDFD